MPNNYVSKLNFTPYVNPYVKGAVDEYGNLINKLEKEYDETAAKYDALKEAADKAVALEPDQEKKNKLIENTRKVLEEAAKAGDYEYRDRAVRKAISDFEKEYIPIAQQVQAQQQFEKEIDDAVKSGKVSYIRGEEAKIVARNRYSKETDNKGFSYNPDGSITRGYASFTKGRVNDINVPERIIKIIKEKHPNSYKNISFDPNNGKYVYETEHGIKEVSKQELENIVRDAYALDREWQDYDKNNAYFNTYLASDETKLATQQNYLNNLDSRVITEDIIKKQISELKPNKNESDSAKRERAISNLRRNGYDTQENINKIKDRISNINPNDFYYQNDLENKKAGAIKFGGDYAWKETEDAIKFKDWTPEYKESVKSAAEKKANNAFNFLKKGTNNASQQISDSRDMLKIDKENLSNISNQLNINKEGLQKRLGVNLNDDNLEKISKILGDSKTTDTQKLNSLKSFGINNISDDDLKAAKLNASNYNLAKEDWVDTNSHIKNQEKILESYFKDFDTQGEYKRFLDKFYGDKEIRSLIGIKDFEQYIKTGSNENVEKAIQLYKTSSTNIVGNTLNDIRERTYKKIQEDNKDKVITTNTFIVNTKEGSDVHAANKNLTKALQSVYAAGLTLEGTNISIGQLLKEQLGDKFDDRKLTVEDSNVNISKTKGKRTANVKFKYDDREYNYSINLEQGVNTGLANDVVKNAYRDAFIDRDPAHLENNKNIMDNIALEEGSSLPNAKDLFDLPKNTKPNEYSEEEKIRSNKYDTTYNIRYKNIGGGMGYYEGYYIDNKGEKQPLKDDEGKNQMRDYNSVMEAIGHLEMQSDL